MSKSKVKSSLSPFMSAMPRCTMELMPEQEVVNSMIVAAEAGEQVEGLANNGFGQVLAHSRKAVVDAGAKVDSYDTAAKIVGGVVEHFKKMVFEEIDARRKCIETGTLVGEDKIDALNDVAKLRARMDNTLKSAKSVITSAIRKGDTVLKIISDGGHILFRKDGTARGKTELQTLVKKAKAYDAPDKSPLEQALAAALLLARRVSDLTNNEDRKTVLDSLKKKIKELDAEKDEIEVEEQFAEAA